MFFTSAKDVIFASVFCLFTSIFQQQAVDVVLKFSGGIRSWDKEKSARFGVDLDLDLAQDPQKNISSLIPVVYLEHHRTFTTFTRWHHQLFAGE